MLGLTFFVLWTLWLFGAVVDMAMRAAREVRTDGSGTLAAATKALTWPVARPTQVAVMIWNGIRSAGRGA